MPVRVGLHTMAMVLVCLTELGSLGLFGIYYLALASAWFIKATRQWKVLLVKSCAMVRVEAIRIFTSTRPTQYIAAGFQRVYSEGKRKTRFPFLFLKTIADLGNAASIVRHCLDEYLGTHAANLQRLGTTPTPEAGVYSSRS